MTTDEFKITLHMVSSLDGRIAKSDNSIGWFERFHTYDKGTDVPDAEAFLEAVDCFVMGARTYEHAYELSANYGWPYGDKPTFVLTKRNLPKNKATIEFYAGALNRLIEEKLKPNFNKVWVAGGAQLAKEFIRQKLVDEIRVSILPIILGEGLLFFDQIGQEHILELKDTAAYKNGMVELCYEIKK